jgi:sigma-E factor negative regulatory protein RseA
MTIDAMSGRGAGDGAARERLSALLDGEAEDGAAAAACAQWRDDAGLRTAWHAYHLIGDVLRSDDLAVPADRDAAFLTSFRERLALEPVVFAPPEPTDASSQVSIVAARPAWRWRASSALAAGIVTVAGAGLVYRVAAPPTPGSTLASAAPAASTVAAAGVDASAAAGTSVAASPSITAPAYGATTDGTLIRDARLDRYLAAHQQFAGTSALGVPSAFLRSATLNSADR